MKKLLYLLPVLAVLLSSCDRVEDTTDDNGQENTGTSGNPNPNTNGSETPDTPVYECVDLGLSVKWATFNVGATKPEEYGDYFAWAATEPLYECGYAQENPQSHWSNGRQSGYTWENTPYQTAVIIDYGTLMWTKYVGSTTSPYKDASATDADALKKVLDPEDDATHVNWGNEWRTPTKEEWEELERNCSSTRTTINGVNGYKLQSKVSGYEDSWIFLPSAGIRIETNLYGVGDCGYYWSSSGLIYGNSSPHEAWYHITISNDYDPRGRSDGLSIRPVCP